jgi:hypothetical protein
LINIWTLKNQTPQFGNYLRKSLLNILNLIRKYAMLNIGLKNMSNNPLVTADRNRIFRSSNDFSMHIEQIVRDKKISYMDAVLQYCKENFIEPEDVAKLVNKSLKDKLEVNFQDENYLPKRAKLDV